MIAHPARRAKGGPVPNITDEAPDYVKTELAELRAALDVAVPRKILDDNLLIATWNIRGFGGLTEKWQSSSSDSPKRDLHALACIAEIVSRFDIVAVQEAKSNIKALRHLMKALGPSWGLILTDVTKGAPGNAERMAFVFDRRKAQLSGLACEIVIPAEQLAKGVESDALDVQFARTPYAVSFKAGDKTVILVTLHVLYGDSASERTPELRAIAEWLADWANSVHAWHHNLIALGDFNIDREGDPRYQAFTSTGLMPPADQCNLPRSIFDRPDRPDPTKFYDQIAWFGEGAEAPALSLDYLGGGFFNFVPFTLKSLELTKTQLSWRISDHYPLWAEFSIRS